MSTVNPLATLRPRTHKSAPSKHPTPTLPLLPYEAALQERELRKSAASVDQRVSAKYDALVRVQQEAETLRRELLESEGYETVVLGEWEEARPYAVHPIYVEAFRRWQSDNPYINHPNLGGHVPGWGVIAL